MTKIKQVFWDKGVSAKAVQLLKLGKEVDGNYRSIQPINNQFSMGENPQVKKFVFISSEVDLVEFLSSPEGTRDSFKGFKLLITNNASENFYLQLNYRVILWQLLDRYAELQEAMELETVPASPAELDLKKLKHSISAVKLFKKLELNLNSFILTEELAMPIQGITREVGGKWNKVHTPTKWK